MECDNNKKRINIIWANEDVTITTGHVYYICRIYSALPIYTRHLNLFCFYEFQYHNCPFQIYIYINDVFLIWKILLKLIFDFKLQEKNGAKEDVYSSSSFIATDLDTFTFISMTTIL